MNTKTTASKPKVPEAVRVIDAALVKEYRKEMKARHPDASIKIRLGRLVAVYWAGAKAWGFQREIRLDAKGYRSKTVHLCIPPDYNRERAWIA
jgi:hypothetical protein